MKNRILVIENRQEILNRVTEILVREHYIVDSSRERNKGVAMALAQEYDIILADADMMQNGDLTVVSEIKKHAKLKDTPIILISTPYKDLEFIEKTKKFEIDGILFRPFNDLDLLSRINPALKMQKHNEKLKEAMKKIKNLQIECDALSELGDLNIDSYLQLKEKYDKESVYDEITSLINLKEFFLRLERVISESIRYEESIIYAIYEIDNFSDFESSFDSETTNDILSAAANIVLTKSRKEDIVAKLWRDSFIVAYKRMREEYIEKVIENIEQSLKKIEICKNDIMIKFSVSIGIACVRYRKSYRLEKIESEIKECELALRNAKRRGAGKIFVHPKVIRL